MNIHNIYYSTVQDWLYDMDGEDANATKFQERVDFLKVTGSPIYLRSQTKQGRLPCGASQCSRQMKCTPNVYTNAPESEAGAKDEEGHDEL
ncbi:unnamed protein product [Eruca vesicaria subsp. sativa]|uniref:Uncharacterized protein n=1 Tax=Eruca vesicaria subsp. sativa TaxID=29727 RepID=A0ABC8K9R6_ERUVS|nr:unnamed protein product [Eruca vesicaria subsp. sativa]